MKYYRCPNPESYYTVDGETVTYFAPHVPNGAVTEDTPDFIASLASRTPTHARLYCEITEVEAQDVMKRLRQAVEDIERRDRHAAEIEASRFRD